MKTSLVILAAGIGSRFGGGVKQLTAMGPAGEIIIDYSIHDALEAGFDKVVFIIRRDIEKDFRDIIGRRIEGITEVAYAYQSLEDLPTGYRVPEGRTKPWGTGQALLVARDVVNEPFAVINADDYYGKKGYALLHRYLTEGQPADAAGRQNIALAGFVLGRTLSVNGGVTRGICRVDDRGFLTGIDETKNIVMTETGAAAPINGVMTALDPEGLVSMNMWGFYPSFFETLAGGFPVFLEGIGDKAATAEYLLPTIVDGLLRNGSAAVSVLPTDDRWFGVTYAEDKESVREAFRGLIDAGIYKTPLFG